MTVAEALDHLQSLQAHGFQPGLRATRRLAALVGDPQERLRFIHVAGTNGKGSVCALLEAVYRASGRRVGLYTSPHLVRFGERIQVDRSPLPDDALARLTRRLRDAVAEASARDPGDPLVPTFFEFTTVLALMWFAEQEVDLAVWETGLGGRWDATNIVTPLASVITNVSLDHQRVLGDTTAAIASEKAGIIKPDVPVLTAADDVDARAVIEFRARELGSPCLVVGPHEVASFRHELGLLGAHQRVNGALAAATVRLLRAWLPVDDAHLASGLADARWPGRLQRIQQGSRTLLLDGAHNRAGIDALRQALSEHFPGQHPTLVVGMLSDKDWPEMAATLTPLARRVLVVPVASPRTVPPESLRAACLAARSPRPVKAVASLAEALRLSASDPLVLVTGSLYLVGEALALLEGPEAARPDLSVGRRLNDWSPPGSGSAPGA